MKKQLRNNSLWLSLLSAVALIIFFLIGTGTDDYGFGFAGLSDYEQTSEYEDGNYKRTSENEMTGDYNVWTGTKDVQGRWDGPVTIEEGMMSPSAQYEPYSTEKVTYVNGRRNGRSITSFNTTENRPDEEVCYSMGKVIPCQKSSAAQTEISSASQLLFLEYPWYVNSLNVKGCDNEFIQAFVDTLETLLFAMEYTGGEFLDYYDYALDSLEGTVYDTILYSNGSLSMFVGQEELLNSQFRLAVLDHSREEGSSTFDIVKTTYPGYLDDMNSADINDPDFEIFCGDVDSLMTEYGPLNGEDPFYTDSVDARLYRAIMYIASYEEDTAVTTEALKSVPVFRKDIALRNYLKSVQSIQFSQTITPRSSEVAFVVFSSFLLHYFQGDKISVVLEESFNNYHSIISLPALTTEYLGGGSTTTADLSGYIHNDGGAAITSSGIAWATHYNPTIVDNTVHSAVTSGSFVVALDGLTEGESYYARTFATNSAGTAYGNCIEFVAASTVGIEFIETDYRFKVYPNPASAITTFSFNTPSFDHLELAIINVKGQVVIRQELGSLTPGNQRIELDLSGLKTGIYQSQLSNRGRLLATQKLVIVH